MLRHRDRVERDKTPRKYLDINRALCEKSSRRLLVLEKGYLIEVRIGLVWR
jgi:hypothetical protein